MVNGDKPSSFHLGPNPQNGPLVTPSCPDVLQPPLRCQSSLEVLYTRRIGHPSFMSQHLSPSGLKDRVEILVPVYYIGKVRTEGSQFFYFYYYQGVLHYSDLLFYEHLTDNFYDCVCLLRDSPSPRSVGVISLSIN